MLACLEHHRHGRCRYYSESSFPQRGAQTGAPAIPAMPDDVKSIRVAGLGILVSDPERYRKFYPEVLDLKVGAKVPAQGEPECLRSQPWEL